MSTNRGTVVSNANDYIYQIGFNTYSTNDEQEIMYHRKAHEMKYKMSYLAYKLKFIWPVVDFLASYFYLILNITVIAFALYSQISVFYGVCLLFLVIQSLMLSQNSQTYRRKMRREF